MDEGDITPGEPIVEPTPPTTFAPPTLLAPPALPPPQATAATGSPPTRDKRRFPWVTVVVGVLAVAAIVVLSVMVVSTSNDKDDAEQALAATQADLDAAEADLAESEAALNASKAALDKAEADLSDTAAQLAATDAARAEADATHDRYQEQLDQYAAASTDFLAASMAAGIGLEQDQARCLAEAIVDSLGAEALSLIVSAAIEGGDATELDDAMTDAADGCGVSDDAFDQPLNSEAFAYGDDPELDALYDNCAGGDGTACDDLYVKSAPGTEYEQFAGTCGNRFEYSDTEPCLGRI